MQISEVKISNFKGIESLELRLKRINVLTGRNNTGKTTILEGVNMLFNPEWGVEDAKRGDSNSELVTSGLEKAKIVVKLGNGEVQQLEIEPPDSLSIVQEIKDRVNTVIEVFYPNMKKNAASANADETLKSIQNEAGSAVDRYFSPAAIEELKKNSILVRTQGKTIVSLGIPENTGSSEEKKSNFAIFIDNIVTSLSTKLDGKPEIFIPREAFFAFLNSPLPRQITTPEPPNQTKVKFRRETRLRVRKKNPEEERRINAINAMLAETHLCPEIQKFDIDFVTLRSKPLPISYALMGDGFKAIAGILWDYNSDIQVLLLDEPEKYMHPGYIKELVKFIKQMASTNYKVQFIIATHNFDFISEFLADPLDQFLEEEFQLITLERCANGIEPTVYSYNDAKEQVEKINNDLRGV